MCKLLKVARSSLYYRKNNEIKSRIDDSQVELLVVESFKNSRKNYGTRRIKQ